MADECEEDVEDSAGVGAEGHGATKGDLAGAGSRGGEEGLFPSLGDLDGKGPGVGCAGFVAAELAGGFVHGAVEGVAIYGGGAGVEPDGRRVFERGDDLVEELCGLDAGVEDGAAVGAVVAAVDAAAGEVDADVGVFELGDPGAGGEAVPWDHAPGGLIRAAGKNGDGVAVRVKVAGEDLADLSGASGDNDAHVGFYLAVVIDGVVGMG